MGRLLCTIAVAGGCSLATDLSDLGAADGSTSPCGHSCIRGACQMGMCQPFVVATGQTSPNGIAADDAYVYWTNGGVLDASYVGSGLGYAPVAGGDGGAYAVAGEPAGYPVAGGGFVWWAGSASVYRARAGDAFPQKIQGVTGVGPLGTALGGDASTLFWSAHQGSGNTALQVGPAAGGAASTIAVQGDAGTAVAADDSFVYWAGVSVFAIAYPCPPDAGPPPMNVPPCGTLLGLQYGGSYVTALAVSGAHVYIGDSQSQEIRAVDKTTATMYAAVPVNGVGGIAADATYVYWVEGNTGRVYRALADLSGSAVIASGQNSPRAITVNTSAIYWANADGAIMGIAKP